jgi:hypothetical protein
LSAFYVYYPGGQVLGHNDLEPVADPGFDVRAYCEAKFGHPSVYGDEAISALYNTEQINAIRGFKS